MSTPDDTRRGTGGDTVRTFSLADANAAVPNLIPLTERTITRLNEAEKRWSERSGDLDPHTVKQAEREELGMIYTEWAQHVTELGAMPKGAFTVDFRSPNEDVLWCWSYGEREIAHTHKTWENFSHRVPLAATPTTKSD